MWLVATILDDTARDDFCTVEYSGEHRLTARNQDSTIPKLMFFSHFSFYPHKAPGDTRGRQWYQFTEEGSKALGRVL